MTGGACQAAAKLSVTVAITVPDNVPGSGGAVPGATRSLLHTRVEQRQSRTSHSAVFLCVCTNLSV